MSNEYLSAEDITRLHALPREEAHQFYAGIWETNSWPLIAELGKKDRFFLLTWILNGKFADKDFVYARCREVEAATDEYLDLWAREHFKSTIISFAGVIQEIVRNPEITIGVFSYNNPNAKKFTNQVKREFEDNERLKKAYPEVIPWKDPGKGSPLWSEDKGIIVKRRGNPKEATLTPHGLIEGLPAGPHYDLRVYDDVITEKEVTTPEMMEKATHMWRQSLNLGKEGGRQWHVGTRYHFNDPYSVMIRENLLQVRTYPATENGEVTGKSAMLSEDYLDFKRRALGSYIFACQFLLNPVADDAQGFKREWLRFTDNPVEWKGMNRYVTCDPANEKKKNSDYSVFWVLGLAPDGNVYVLDCVRDRLNLTERADILFALHRQYKPRAVGYEKYGKDSDIQHFEDRMRRDNYRFSITPLGGTVRKEDRIRRLVPFFEEGRVWLPEVMMRHSDNKHIDLVRHFIDQEYLAFPVGVHDDMLDSMARILDPEFFAVWPKDDDYSRSYSKRTQRSKYERRPQRATTWMSM